MEERKEGDEEKEKEKMKRNHKTVSKEKRLRVENITLPKGIN